MRHCSEMYKIIRKKFKITKYFNEAVVIYIPETLAFNYNQHIQQQLKFATTKKELILDVPYELKGE